MQLNREAPPEQSARGFLRSWGMETVYITAILEEDGLWAWRVARPGEPPIKGRTRFDEVDDAWAAACRRAWPRRAAISGS
ncbi:hypothetical protein [Roseococcus sp. YIM B11640]|uniref:hypothetical protein n=1 Tax=Roseococcus sp. YIM B11640 TaxID=3133973 RepID=UPI003C7E353C